MRTRIADQTGTMVEQTHPGKKESKAWKYLFSVMEPFG
jgi:hypothetical protein